MKNVTNSISIKHLNGEDHGPSITVEKRQHDQKCNFEIEMESDPPEFNDWDILRSFGSNDISSLSLDIYHRSLLLPESPDYRNTLGEVKSIYQIYKRLPDLQELTFKDKLIAYRVLAPVSLIINQLTTVKLGHAVMVSKFLSQLSNIAPNLTKLELDTCRMVRPDGLYKAEYRIPMLYNSFNMLTLSLFPYMMYDDDDDFMGVKHMRNMHKVLRIRGGIAFLHSTTQLHGKVHVQYFMMLDREPLLSLSADD